MITDDPTAALQEVGRGGNVVLIVGENFSWPEDIRLRPGPVGAVGSVGSVGSAGSVAPGAGLLAVMVGDPADPATMAAAQEMHEELFSTRR